MTSWKTIINITKFEMTKTREATGDFFYIIVPQNVQMECSNKHGNAILCLEMRDRSGKVIIANNLKTFKND